MLHNIFCPIGRYNVVSYADASFLQMFLWKRALSPKLDEFKALKLEKIIVDGEEREKT